MPFIPHTDADTEAMLATIGVGAIEDLFDEIPDVLRCGPLSQVPPGLNEMEIGQLMAERAAADAGAACFIGAGAYDHHIPAAVWEITTRGEYYSAYTPYQAEASQGTLQLLYEYQSMMTALLDMDVSNASMYDGASGLAEAVLMAVRCNRKSKSGKVLVPRTLHPLYRKVVNTIVRNQGIELLELPFDSTGVTELSALDTYAGEDIAAVVAVQPNYFGRLEPVDALVDWAADNKAMSIAVVNPLAVSLLKPPGQWGRDGVDIACGEGQPLGVPLASGGPYYGFLCSKKAHVRQMPGRIVGRTVDVDGKDGYTLTLQAREQHIRRSKATSNICTNQGLLVTASTIHMAIMGGQGLQDVARRSHQNTDELCRGVQGVAGVERAFDGPVFHEAVIRLPGDADGIVKAMAECDILMGQPLAEDYPELENCVLICATEKRTAAEIASYVEQLDRIVGDAASSAA